MEQALPLLGVAASVAVALLFAVAGIDKLLNRTDFPNSSADMGLDNPRPARAQRPHFRNKRY